jgi:hypothetical protein
MQWPPWPASQTVIDVFLLTNIILSSYRLWLSVWPTKIMRSATLVDFICDKEIDWEENLVDRNSDERERRRRIRIMKKIAAAAGQARDQLPTQWWARMNGESGME